jgi:hypothetical protein
MPINLKNFSKNIRQGRLGENRAMDILRKTVNLHILIFLALYIFSWFSLKTLPPFSEMHPDLMKEPVQQTTMREKFSFDYRGTQYDVKPLAEYELFGLVVSRNNINDIFNFYWDKNTVNIVDVCVVWGSNLKTEVYRKMKFSSGEWTCYPEWGDYSDTETMRTYKNNQLSNNHLLSDNPEIQEKMRSLRIGDQVHIKGILAGYAPEGTPEQYYRNSSLSRDDAGNHACEVVFVDQLDIPERGMEQKYLMESIGLYGLIIMIAMKLGLFYFEFRSSFNRKM